VPNNYRGSSGSKKIPEAGLNEMFFELFFCAKFRISFLLPSASLHLPNPSLKAFKVCSIQERKFFPRSTMERKKATFAF
jgi:hypothetical protein